MSSRVAAAARFARRHDLLVATGLLGLIAAIWFWPLFTGAQLSRGHVLWEAWPWRGERPDGYLPQLRNGPVDAPLQFHPLLTLARHQIAGGFLPLWNPDSYAGMPLLGDLQTALLYPISWLALVFSPDSALGWVALLRLLTAGAGAYALSRQLRIGRSGSLVAGVVYMLCAPNVIWLQWPLGTEFTILPWLLLATDRVYRAPTAGRIAAVGVAVLLNVLAGHPESALLSQSAAAVYLLALLAADRRRWTGWRGRASVLGGWSLGTLLGVAAAGIVLGPFLEAWLVSITRAAHESLASSSLPAWSAIVYALPNIFGDGKPGYWGPPFSYLIVAAYVGVAALLLAGVSCWRGRRRPTAIALAAMAAVALAVIYAIPPISWFVQNVPPYSQGNNARAFYIVAIALAVGAGGGFASLARRRLAARSVGGWSAAFLALVAVGVLVARHENGLGAPSGVERDAAVQFAVFFALGVLCLFAVGRLPRAAALVLVVGVCIADLAYLQPWNALESPSRASPPRPPALAFLDRQPGLFRVSRFRASVHQPEVLPPNTQAIYGIEGVGGYDYPQSERWSNFSYDVLKERGITREVNFLTPPSPDAPARAGLRLLNTRYLLAAPGAVAPAPSWRAVYRGRDGTVFRDRDALPRAWLVRRVRRVRDRAALAILRRGALDPAREALVPPDAPPPPPGAIRPLAVRRPAPDRLEITIPPGAGGWLVISEPFWPMWEATVDGRSRRLWPTDYAISGLPVRPGERKVELAAGRTGFEVGAGVSALAVAALLGLALSGWRRARTRRPGRSPRPAAAGPPAGRPDGG